MYVRCLRTSIKNANSYSTVAQATTQKPLKSAQKSSTKRIKGMSDYLGESMSKLNLIESEAKKVMQLYGYNKVNKLPHVKKLCL
jgi:histidyl-tRNA synthetase